MPTATPSAKAHERVTGRWPRDIEVNNPREWTIYSLKQVVGTPIPVLMCFYALLTFLSREGLELTAWACAILTCLYILLDRLSQQREFTFFRIGGDFFLLGYVLVGLTSALLAGSNEGAFEALDGLRWVVLLYAMAYCWELFPGLNRIFTIAVAGSVIAALYGIWQHFTGLDLIHGTELVAAPVRGTVFFTPVSFFTTPESFGTLLAMTLPFPVAAYLLDDRRDSRLASSVSVTLTLILVLALMWTYRHGLWIAALAGLIVAIIMQAHRGFRLVLIIGIFVCCTLMFSYGSRDQIAESVDKSEAIRADRQRTQINTQFKVWEQNRWLGAGHPTLQITDAESGNGNVYFEVLAQSGLLGISFYLLLVLGFMLSTYRIFSEIPKSHYWHRVLIVGSLGSQVAFHVAGLYWSTMVETVNFNLFILVLSATSYLSEHYGRGPVPDDRSL